MYLPPRGLIYVFLFNANLQVFWMYRLRGPLRRDRDRYAAAVRDKLLVDAGFAIPYVVFQI